MFLSHSSNCNRSQNPVRKDMADPLAPTMRVNGPHPAFEQTSVIPSYTESQVNANQFCIRQIRKIFELSLPARPFVGVETSRTARFHKSDATTSCHPVKRRPERRASTR